MKYHRNGLDFWDAWFMNDHGTVHAFHLQMPDGTVQMDEKEGRSVGHLTTTDLIHWHFCGNVLEPLFDESRPLDFHQKFTGCAYQKDGKTYLYYTMRDKEYSQRLGVALSDDAMHYELYPDNPVIVPDPKVLISYDNRSQYTFDGIVDCRDLLVVYNPDDELYYGYFAAGADVGRTSPIGVIAVATSKDLLHWDNQSIAYMPRTVGVVEVPDVFYMDGKWYMTILCGANYVGRGGMKDEYVTNGTLYATSDSPRGPFIEADDSLFMGGTLGSGFTCRNVEFNGKRYVLYVDRSNGGWSLALPKEIKVVNGCLRPCYSPLVEQARLRPWIPTGIRPGQNSFAWNSIGGKTEEKQGSICLETETISGHYSWWQPTQEEGVPGNVEVAFNLTLDATAAGPAFLIDNVPYILTLEPDKNRTLLLKSYCMDYVAGREVKLERNLTYHVRAIVVDGVAEIYIDDVLYTQVAVPKSKNVLPGLYCENGKATISEVEIYKLEE